MLNPNRIPELANRERFIKRVLTNGGISFVAGDDGWACVPFKQDPARDVVLFWSSPSEANRWAEVVATNPKVHDVTLDALLADVLPMLAERRCLVGTDWSTDPADPVLDADDLSARIWRERGEQFMTAFGKARHFGCLRARPGLLRCRRNGLTGKNSCRCGRHGKRRLTTSPEAGPSNARSRCRLPYCRPLSAVH